MRIPGFVVLAILCLLFTVPGFSADLAIDAGRLADALDRMQVEQRWPAGVHVSWETGMPDGKPERTDGKHTHCSAFVAAVAKKLDVYILRPPEHGQMLLANAQYDWLADAGAQHGWRPLQGGEQAQAYANRGYLVVATYRNHHDNLPGHIAIVRPSAKSAREIAADGPQIIQAGGTNYASTTLRRGFAGHPAAWARGEVRFYAHAVQWQRLPAG